jgi:hypothetical protein
MIPDSCGKNIEAFGKLSRTVDAIADKFPVYQIFAMGNRNSGKIFKCTVDQIIILADAANTWIRPESRDNGIIVCNGFRGISNGGKSISHPGKT